MCSKTSFEFVLDSICWFLVCSKNPVPKSYTIILQIGFTCFFLKSRFLTHIPEISFISLNICMFKILVYLGCSNSNILPLQNQMHWIMYFGDVHVSKRVFWIIYVLLNLVFQFSRWEFSDAFWGLYPTLWYQSDRPFSIVAKIKC